MVRHEIIFHRGIHLDDITLLSSHRQIVNLHSDQVRWSLTDLKGVRAVLKGTTVLSGVHRETKADERLPVICLDGRVVLRQQKPKDINLQPKKKMGK